MSLLPAFSPSQCFTQDVLPGLLPAGPTLTHVVATYNNVGSSKPTYPAKISRKRGLTTIVFSGLTLGRIQTDVTSVLASKIDASAPVIATVYLGGRQFSQMMQLVVFLREARPDARIITIACPCITTEQETVVRQGVRSGKLAAAAWCDCGGPNMTQDIRRAIEKNWSTEPSVDPGA